MIRMAFAVACGGVIGTCCALRSRPGSAPNGRGISGHPGGEPAGLPADRLSLRHLSRPAGYFAGAAWCTDHRLSWRTHDVLQFSLDALRLLESGQLATAFAYVGGSVLGGLLAAWAGLALARL